MAMNGNSNWLASPDTSNKFGNSYINSFIDMSGGNLILRNNNIIVKSGDVNVCGLISQDLTQATSTRDLSASMVPLSTVVNNFITNQVNTFSALNTFSQGILVSTTPLTAQSQLIVAGDTSFNGRLFVGSDCSLSGNVNVLGTMTASGSLIAMSDVSMNGRLFVARDVSLNGNLAVSGNITLPGSGTHTITGTVTTGNSACTTSTVTGNDTVIGNETISGMVYANGGFYGTSGKTITVTGNVIGTSAGGSYLTSSTASITNVSTANYGTNWQGLAASTGLVTNGAYASISCSSTGQYMTTCVTGGLVYLSSNYGTNWASTGVTLPTTSGYPATAVSSTGQYILASSSKVYLSSNFGNSWLDLSGANVGLPTATTGANFRSLSTSSTGQYMITCTTGAAGQVYLSSNYGQTWLANPGKTLTTGSNFYATAMSSTGQYILAAINGGLVWLSNDYGQSWASVSGLASAAYYALGMNSTGQYMVACINGGLVWLSGNYGQTWATITGLTAANYQSVSISSTGQYMAVGIYGGLVYGSTNFGQTWASMGLSAANYSGIAISATGQYMLTCVNGGQVYMTMPPSPTTVAVTSISGILSTTDLSLNGNLYTNMMNTSIVPMTKTYTVAGVGKKWQTLGAANGFPATTTANARHACMSTNGQYILVVLDNQGAWLSTNYGQTWANQSNGIITNGNFTRCAMSSDGKYMITGNYGNSLYLSSNYGGSWTANPGSGLAASLYYHGFAISANGQYILTCGAAGGSVYLSTNTGSTWTVNPGGLTASSGDQYLTLSMSATGQYMLVGRGSVAVYLSKDYGSTFNAVTIVTGTWVGSYVSSTGQYMYMCANTTQICYRSADYGVTWTSVGLGANSYHCIGGSSTGQYIVLSIYGSSPFFSNDYGSSWNPIIGTGNYYCTIMSGNGQYIFAGTASGNSNYLSSTTDLSYSTVLTNVPYMNIKGYVGFSDMSGSYTNPSVKALVEINGTSGTIGSNVDAYSLFTSGSILSGQNLVVASDRRIKNNIIDVVDVSALDVIRKLKPKQYTYIDVKNRGPNPVWGYIAQEVGEVLDYAVNKTTEYIPSVYQNVTIDGNRLTCPGIRTKLIVVDAGSDDPTRMIVADTGSDDPTRLIGSNEPTKPINVSFTDTLGRTRYATINQLMDDDETAYLTTSLTDSAEEWFMFGHQIYDFNALDKMAVYTVATAALQELDREYQETKNDVAELTTQMEEMLRQLEHEPMLADESIQEPVIDGSVDGLTEDPSQEPVIEVSGEEHVADPSQEPVIEGSVDGLTEEPIVDPSQNPIV